MRLGGVSGIVSVTNLLDMWVTTWDPDRLENGTASRAHCLAAPVRRAKDDTGTPPHGRGVLAVRMARRGYDIQLTRTTGPVHSSGGLFRIVHFRCGGQRCWITPERMIPDTRTPGQTQETLQRRKRPPGHTVCQCCGIPRAFHTFHQRQYVIAIANGRLVLPDGKRTRSYSFPPGPNLGCSGSRTRWLSCAPHGSSFFCLTKFRLPRRWSPCWTSNRPEKA